jgi:hypothetical protein
MPLITREQLAERWNTSVRTIDRRRLSGELTWIDLAGGKGGRPIVRFLLRDVEDYENRMRLNCHNDENR